MTMFTIMLPLSKNRLQHNIQMARIIISIYSEHNLLGKTFLLYNLSQPHNHPLLSGIQQVLHLHCCTLPVIHSSVSCCPACPFYPELCNHPRLMRYRPQPLRPCWTHRPAAGSTTHKYLTVADWPPGFQDLTVSFGEQPLRHTVLPVGGSCVSWQRGRWRGNLGKVPSSCRSGWGWRGWGCLSDWAATSTPRCSLTGACLL